MPGIFAEPLEELVGAIPAFISPGSLLELFKHTRMESAIDDVIRQMAEVLRQLHIWPERYIPQAAQFLEIRGRKSTHPSAQFL